MRNAELIQMKKQNSDNCGIITFCTGIIRLLPVLQSNTTVHSVLSLINTNEGQKKEETSTFHSCRRESQCDEPKSIKIITWWYHYLISFLSGARTTSPI